MRRFPTILSTLLFSIFSTAAVAQTALPPQPPLAPYALGPRTVVPAMVACTDLPVTAPSTSTLRIVASHAGTLHQQYVPNEIVVLNGGTPQGLAAGQRYFIRRLQLGFDAEPPTPQTPGAVRTTGWLTVVAADEQSALARIDFACDGVGAGDYLEPFVEPTLPPAVAADGPADFTNLGKVMFGADRRQTFGDGDFLNIDRGSGGGITLGQRVAFYRDRMNGTPLVEMGAGVVVEVSAETSKVVVTRARDAVRMGDYFAVRGK